MGSSLENIFGFYKTRHILLSNGANCTVATPCYVRAVILTQYRRVTNGQTDGTAVANTALTMRALRRAVKNRIDLTNSFIREGKQYLKSNYIHRGMLACRCFCLGHSSFALQCRRCLAAWTGVIRNESTSVRISEALERVSQ